MTDSGMGGPTLVIKRDKGQITEAIQDTEGPEGAKLRPVHISNCNDCWELKP
jgi:hypothetical protein